MNPDQEQRLAEARDLASNAWADVMRSAVVDGRDTDKFRAIRRRWAELDNAADALAESFVKRSAPNQAPPPVETTIPGDWFIAAESVGGTVWGIGRTQHLAHRDAQRNCDGQLPLLETFVADRRLVERVEQVGGAARDLGPWTVRDGVARIGGAA